MIELRPPHSVSELSTSPEIPLQIPRRIYFRHPGYPSPNLLFHAFGFDSLQGGLHHETARLMCAVVANNRWDGYLSETPTGTAIDVPANGLLEKNDYYFIVPRLQGASAPTDTPQSSSPPELDPYPIVPIFRHWRFPHNNLPPSWQHLPPADNSAIRSSVDAVRLRDASCRMTEFEDECEVAHLCPRQEEAWFSSNEMGRYGANSSAAIDTPSNLVLLRSDVHKIFDKKSFVFIPKLDNTICTHVLSDGRQQRSLYHNTKLHPVTLGAEYLFTRFAWAIFPQLSQFLQRRRRTLLALGDGTTAWADAWETAEFAKPQQSRTSSPTKQSRSPTKRSRTQFEDTQGHNHATNFDNPERGRKRWRPDEATTRERNKEKPFDQHHRTSTPPLDNSQSTISTTRPTNNPANEEEVDLGALVQQSLLKERARSDPDGHWVKEQQWATAILAAGGALDPSDYARFWRTVGCDDADEV